jgi:hypothetical protein
MVKGLLLGWTSTSQGIVYSFQEKDFLARST